MEWRLLCRGLKARYRDQRLEIVSLERALAPTDTAVDVGANKGSYLWSLSRAVPGGRVVAFEPQPTLATYLREACRSAGLRNVTIEAAGVSDHAGPMTLAIPGGSETSPGASFSIAADRRGSCRLLEAPVVTLDQYFAYEPGRIGAIKIDVEGHELAVLRGATGLIREHRPAIVCEIEGRHLAEGGVSTVFDLFAELSYEGRFVDGHRLRPIAEFDPAIHQRSAGPEFWKAPGYCNNFMMTPVTRAAYGCAPLGSRARP